MRSTGIWDDPGKNQFSPSSVVSRQTSVHHVTLSDKTIQYIQYSKAIGLVMQRYTGFTIYRGMNIYSYHTMYICLSAVSKRKATGPRISPAHVYHLYPSTVCQTCQLVPHTQTHTRKQRRKSQREARLISPISTPLPKKKVIYQQCGITLDIP